MAEFSENPEDGGWGGDCTTGLTRLHVFAGLVQYSGQTCKSLLFIQLIFRETSYLQ